MNATEEGIEIAALKSQLREAVRLLEWYTDNDDTHESECNAYWLKHRDAARELIAQHADIVKELEQ